MTERTRCPILHVHESELQDWYGAEWAYVGRSEKPEFCIIEWPHSRDPVAPLRCVQPMANAAASLEGSVER